jgi:signal transduction histidine kinase
MDCEPDIPWARVAAFVRQHTHDVRNALNSLDLETAILEEFVHEDEGHASLDRVRRQIRALAEQLRSLSALFQDLEPISAPIAARELFLIWQEKHAALAHAPAVRWIEEIRDERVSVDVEMMATVFGELLINAAAFPASEPAIAAARPQGDGVVFELIEAQKVGLDTSKWGEPFSTTRRGGYGLGLWAAKRLAEANGAVLSRRYVPEEGKLTTQLVLAKI